MMMIIRPMIINV